MMHRDYDAMIDQISTRLFSDSLYDYTIWISPSNLKADNSENKIEKSLFSKSRTQIRCEIIISVPLS